MGPRAAPEDPGLRSLPSPSSSHPTVTHSLIPCLHYDPVARRILVCRSAAPEHTISDPRFSLEPTVSTSTARSVRVPSASRSRRASASAPKSAVAQSCVTRSGRMGKAASRCVPFPQRIVSSQCPRARPSACGYLLAQLGAALRPWSPSSIRPPRFLDCTPGCCAAFRLAVRVLPSRHMYQAPQPTSTEQLVIDAILGASARQCMRRGKGENDPSWCVLLDGRPCTFPRNACS